MRINFFHKKVGFLPPVFTLFFLLSCYLVSSSIESNAVILSNDTFAVPGNWTDDSCTANVCGVTTTDSRSVWKCTDSGGGEAESHWINHDNGTNVSYPNGLVKFRTEFYASSSTALAIEFMTCPTMCDISDQCRCGLAWLSTGTDDARYFKYASIDSGSLGVFKELPGFTSNTWYQLNVSLNYSDNSMDFSLSGFGGNISLSDAVNPRCFNISKGRLALHVSAGEYSLDYTEIYYLDNITVDTTPPTITFLNQTPSDIDTDNTIGIDVLIFYNISDESGVNESTVKMYYKINTTNTLNYQFINGTGESNFLNKDKVSNLSNTFRFSLDDNQIYPGTYNLDHEIVEHTVHINLSLQNNDVGKIELYNVTTNNTFNQLEVMIQKQNINSPALEVYYCNSSYTSGIITTSNYCTLFTQLDNGFHHTHTNYSSHMLISVPINSTTSTINNVGVTETSFFLFKSTNVNGWNLAYITNQSRIDAHEFSLGNGASWTQIVGSIDSHLHQFSGSDLVIYKVEACDLLGNCGNSTIQTDLIQLKGLPPSSPIITIPTGRNYTTEINITYQQSVSPNGFPITKYNITLLNPDESFNQTIILNNSPNLFYLWNISSIQDNSYKIRVGAIDNESQSSFAISELFQIDNTLPTLMCGNITVFTGLNFSFSCNGTDERDIYSFGLRCINDSNSFENWKTDIFNISSTSFSYTNSSNSTTWGNSTCISNLSDSHTGTVLEKKHIYEVVNKGEKFVFDNLNISTGNVSSLIVNKLTDRYILIYNFTTYGTHTFIISAKYIDYIKYSGYIAHFVVNRDTWIDFENDLNKKPRITKLYNGDYEVKFYNIKNIMFNSIGELNTVYKNFTVEISGCIENWSCTAWVNNGSCAGNLQNQTRICTDSVNCGTTFNKPDELQAIGCLTETPSSRALNMGLLVIELIFFIIVFALIPMFIVFKKIEKTGIATGIALIFLSLCAVMFAFYINDITTVLGIDSIFIGTFRTYLPLILFFLAPILIILGFLIIVADIFGDSLGIDTIKEKFNSNKEKKRARRDFYPKY